MQNNRDNDWQHLRTKLDFDLFYLFFSHFHSTGICWSNQITQNL